MYQLTNDLKTNVAQIDSQHEELFKRINDVVNMNAKAATKEETDKTIKLLGDYITKHFNDEEALQRKYNYPKYEAHRKLHQIYVKSFNDLKAEYDKNGPSIAFTLQLNKSIIEWIVKHIKNVDVDLGIFINSKI